MYTYIWLIIGVYVFLTYAILCQIKITASFLVFIVPEK